MTPNEKRVAELPAWSSGLTPEDRAAFSKLTELDNNWDSYSAMPIDPDCIAEAQTMLSSLRKAGWGGPWSIVPCSNGGVQIEQHCYGKDIEICISKASHTVAALPTLPPSNTEA